MALGLKYNIMEAERGINIIDKSKDNNNCVCSLSNSNGESVYKIFGEKLAKQWNLYRIFTGTHKQCLDFMQANGY